jgi:AcrR family transcriptional regulator
LLFELDAMFEYNEVQIQVPRNAAKSPRPSLDEPTRELPRSRRGQRTRAALVEGARTVFERDGYLNARLADISAEANCATGSLYTYFSGKEEIFAAVLEDAQEEMLHPHVREATKTDDPIALIKASNRAYLVAYRRNAKLMGLLDEVAAVDDEIRLLRRRRTAAFIRRNAASIRDLQERRLADPELDPQLTAAALSWMVSRMAYSVFVLGDYRVSLDGLVAELTRLWANALRLTPSD